jgi:hypothetical protein
MIRDKEVFMTLKLSLLAAIFSIFPSLGLSITYEQGRHDYYIGISGDLQGVTLRANGVGSDKIFVKSVMAKNIYFGYTINEFLGFETGGHHLSPSQNGLKHYGRGVHGTFILRTLKSKRNPFSLYGGLGIAHLRHKVRGLEFNANYARAVTRAMVGVDVSANQTAVVRTGIVWHRMAALSRKPERFHNSYALSAGLHFYF